MSQADANQLKTPEAVPSDRALPPTPPRGPRWKRWVLPALALGLVVVLAWAIWGQLRDEVWAYFTDDVGTRVEVQEDKVRSVLWQDPRQNVFVEKRDPKAPAAIDPINRPGGRLEAAFSPDGTMMVLVRWQSDKLDSEVGDGEAATSADLYFSRWNGRIWSRPAPIAGINTEANERGPVLSRDGRYLFFSSDRAGGQGGYDLYVARWDGLRWTGAEALGGAINTPAQELGPALSADGSRLYFSSDRSGGSTEDIYVARRVGEPAAAAAGGGAEPGARPTETPGSELKAGTKENQRGKGRKGKQSLPPIEVRVVVGEPQPLPPVPAFERVEPVDHLNSDADDVQAALTARGDHVFLASDRDRSRAGQTGFGVYLSRVVEGQVMPPEKVDLYIRQGNATDPAVRMEGFDLLFSTDIELQEDGLTAGTPEAFRLYRSTTREVIGWFDLSRWEQFKELLSNIIWWILLAIAALIALIYLLERWQDITSLFHKCLAGSVAVHLMLLIVAMLWLIVQEFGGAVEQSPEIAISIDALAQEELALESEPDKAEMTDSKVALVTDKIKSDFKIPNFKPLKPSKPTPIVRSTAKVSLVDDIRPSKANETPDQQPTPKLTLESELLKALPETLLPDPENPVLEESNVPDEQTAEKVTDPTSDLFKPTKSIPQVITEQAQEKAIKAAAIKESTKASEVEPSKQAAKTENTDGDLVRPHRGLVADGLPPQIDGVGNKPTTLLNLGGPDSQSDPFLPKKLSTPDHDLDGKALTKLLRKQRGKPSLETIEQMGGSDATEKAIAAAIEWLRLNQEPDGRWDVRKHGAKGAYDTAGTGLALLCFYGWDIKHNVPGKYQQTVQKGLDWLLKQQKENGDLRGGGRMYCHGIAAIALCEAYGITKDPKLREPAQKAIDLIVASQSKTKGGWRYDPRPTNDSDTSVTGWQYMALHSAQMADLNVPDVTMEKAQRWFDHVGGGRHGGLYGYQGPGKNSPAMVATGMFCRQLDLVPPTDPRMGESADVLKMRPMKARQPDFYYVYYATLALYQHQGPIWKKWNEEHLKTDLVRLQIKTGQNQGSWDPGAGHGATGGRVVSTALGVLSMEVYYRLLPMYGFRNKDAAPAPKVKLKGRL